MMEIGEEVLDHVWNCFLSMVVHDNKFYSKIYSRVSRRSPASQNFESWLFEYGAVVQRRDKKMYIQFLDDRQATIFLLRWAT